MHQETENLGSIVEHHLELEAKIVETLEAINEGMSAILQDAGIYGPTTDALDALAPLLERLQNQSAESQQSRRTLYAKVRSLSADDAACEPAVAITLQDILTDAPRDVWQKKQALTQRLTEASQQLASNQVVLFYSMEFHRRYLLGVLECNRDESNYQADGQTFKLAPEKLFGRNC